MRAAYLLSPSFITRGRMGASKAALILMKNFHLDRRTLFTVIQIMTSKFFSVPEATGIITGCVFLMVTFVMIPLTFSGDLANLSAAQSSDFPHAEFAQLISALLSISCMLMLGFADDVLDLRWRHKLLLPTMASMPLLLVYYVTANRTQVVLPLFVQVLYSLS